MIIKLSASRAINRVSKNLANIHGRDIPIAKSAASRRAGDAVLADASGIIADAAEVPKWMIRGIGRKKLGSRIGRTGYKAHEDGVFLFFRSRDVRPGGNKYKEITGMRGISKGKNYRVRAGKHVYRRAIMKRSLYGVRPRMVYEFTSHNKLKPVKIKLGLWAEFMFKKSAKKVFPKMYKKRFEHELRRRLGIRGSR